MGQNGNNVSFFSQSQKLLLTFYSHNKLGLLFFSNCVLSPAEVCSVCNNCVRFLRAVFCFQGLLGNDKDLAGALWRIFFEMRHDVDPAHLELLVAYIRKQVSLTTSQGLPSSHPQEPFSVTLPLSLEDTVEALMREHP